VDILSFIDTEPIESVEVQQEIENALILSATVVVYKYECCGSRS
jgi:hypothetical protein